MSTLASTFLPEDVLVLGSAQPVIGTAMLGDDFGKIKSLSVKRTGDEEELTNGAGGLRAHVIKKPGLEASIDVLFDATVTPPALYALITLPFFNVTARVMPGVEIKYDDGKERMLSLTVKMWDALLNEPAFRLDTLTGIFYLLDIGIPVVPAPTPASGQLTLNWPDVTDAVSYVVQVSADAGVTWTTLATPTPSTYVHTGIAGLTKHYRVAAVNADGQGEWSEVVSGTAGA